MTDKICDALQELEDKLTEMRDMYKGLKNNELMEFEQYRIEGALIAISQMRKFIFSTVLKKSRLEFGKDKRKI